MFHLFLSYCVYREYIERDPRFFCCRIIWLQLPPLGCYHNWYVPLPHSFSSLSVSSRADFCKPRGRGILGQLKEVTNEKGEAVGEVVTIIC
jgi:hypothetical protein